MKWTILKQYLENSSIHGFKHLVQIKDYHWIERLFWIIICGLNWYGCALIILSLFDQVINRPIAITAETSYINWKTEFPSLALCTSFSKEAEDYLVKIINSRGKMGERYRKKLTTTSSASGYVQDLERKLTADDLISIYSKVKMNCSNIFSECSWNGKPFDCCDEFGFLQSPVGFCYMFNSIHARQNKKSFKFMVSRISKNGYLSLNFTNEFSNWNSNTDVKVYFLNNYDIPSVMSGENKEVVKRNIITAIDFTMEDIINDEGVKNLSPNKRKCRFADENHQNSVYKHYSHEGCLIDLTLKNMIEKCGCVSFRYPRKPHMPVCNMTEMRCISELIEKSGFMGHECLPDCDGSFIYKSQWNNSNVDAKVGGIRMQLISTPFVRYRRYIVYSILDIIVSVGSAIGLFTGASILSFVEIIYWFFVY